MEHNYLLCAYHYTHHPYIILFLMYYYPIELMKKFSHRSTLTYLGIANKCQKEDCVFFNYFYKYYNAFLKITMIVTYHATYHHAIHSNICIILVSLMMNNGFTIFSLLT